MGRLRQTTIWRSRTGVALPRPLYSSRRHLQPSIGRIRWRQRHVPLEGLCSRKCATHDDRFRRGVYSPVPAARAPEELCSHPALRLHGQLPAFHFLRTLPPAVANGARPSFTPNGFGNFNAVVSYLSDALDCRREIDGCSDCLEIRFEMLCRYVVGKIPNRTDDVLLLADVDVCLHIAQPCTIASKRPATTLQNSRVDITYSSSPTALRSCHLSSREHIKPHSRTFSIA